jgi:serine/threonine protein kinase
LRIADFGLDKAIDEKFRLATTVCGTWAYTAPEVTKREDYDYKADMFSFGVILFIVLSEYHPFDPEVGASDAVIIRRAQLGKHDFEARGMGWYFWRSARFNQTIAWSRPEKKIISRSNIKAPMDELEKDWETGHPPKLQIKGLEAARRDYAPLLVTTQMKMLNILLLDGDRKKAIEYVKGVVKDLMSNKVPLEMLVMSKKLSRAPDWNGFFLSFYIFIYFTRKANVFVVAVFHALYISHPRFPLSLKQIPLQQHRLTLLSHSQKALRWTLKTTPASRARSSFTGLIDYDKQKNTLYILIITFYICVYGYLYIYICVY